MSEIASVNYGYTFARLSKDKRISYQSIAIYDVLSSLAGDGYKCTATVQELCDMLQMTPKTFFKYQNELISAGYLSKKRQGGHNGNVYTLELAKSVFKDMKDLYSVNVCTDEALDLPVPVYFELSTGNKLTKDLIHAFGSVYDEQPNWAINYAISKALNHDINNPIETVLYAKRVVENWVADPCIRTKDDVDEQDEEYHARRLEEQLGW
ncbi:hypothetical protein M3M35_00150 [Fructilactobacillus myrtifloralis]|uniref:DnaD domain protein n=1 Tax=Fructilactobacillus myrtifloralis TaxID=2940301 RepID=A0ABY5BN68_9LACO|nr:hypothetical protein [Fructilactobacillus myrtifloralis]USS85122.1 hypothetical protein M3M35_00150 [Fructilactobacillus myrtifloralis]